MVPQASRVLPLHLLDSLEQRILSLLEGLWLAGIGLGFTAPVEEHPLLAHLLHSLATLLRAAHAGLATARIFKG